MKEPVSIFNDVIGPVMIGPSSSHTAAGARIGYFIRRMLNDQPERVTFTFSTNGSLADCHEPQGTDMGLAGGLLGMAMDDPAMECSPQLAAEAGIIISYETNDEPVDHPNIYDFTAEGGGRKMTGQAISVGGGMIEFRKINGYPVSMAGGFYETLVFAETGDTDQLNAMESALGGADGQLKKLCSGDEKEILYILETEEAFDAGGLKDRFPAVKDVISLDPVLPVRSFHTYTGLFNTAEEVLRMASEKKMELWDIAAAYESARGRMSPDEVFAMMGDLADVMERTLAAVRDHQKDYADRILGPQAYKLHGYDSPLLPPFIKDMISCITYFMEAKSSMEVIVAAPTCGSSAVLPGTLISAVQNLGGGREELIKGLLAAGMVGVIIAEHSTFSAEIAGCQAECGAASAMAAAGLAQLMGRSAEEALSAASMALQNIMGSVCDPVAGRVEVPCLGKNVQAGMNALASANMAAAGFDAVIPFDEAVTAFDEAGRKIAPELRNTCRGGLSIAPASLAIEKQLKEFGHR